MLSNIIAFILVVVAALLIVFLLALWPLLAIWSLNTLFPNLQIPYNFQTWTAMFFLYAFFKTSFNGGKNKSGNKSN
jgi:membrane-associated phospholipid phosphatase